VARRQPKIISIKPVSIRIGDRINVKGMYQDAEIKRTGLVAKRDVSGITGTTTWLTAGGITLLEQYRDGTCDLAKAHVYLLNRAPDLTLF